MRFKIIIFKWLVSRLILIQVIGASGDTCDDLITLRGSLWFAYLVGAS